MREAMTKKLVGYWTLMTRRARNAMTSCRIQCDLQGRADADFYTLTDAAIPCSSATTARPWGLVAVCKMLARWCRQRWHGWRGAPTGM